MEVIKLIGFTIATWLLHLGIASAYIRLFATPTSLWFRLVHSLEIAVLVGAMLLIANTKLGALPAIATVLGTLAVADLILFGAFKSLREQFDIWHFVVAYSVVALVIIAVKSR